MPSTEPAIDAAAEPRLCRLASDRPAPDIDTTEVHAYGMGLESISAVVGLQSFTNLRSLSLHGNHISFIEGLEALHHLENLNLSSNHIRRVEGISHLSQLKVLDLSSNFIEEIRGFQGLTSLVRLVLAHNRIEKLRGLAIQDGPGYSLKYLDIHDNRICSLSELWFLAGCMNLQELVLARGQQANTVCKESMYVVTIVSILPHLEMLDGRLLRPQQSNDALNLRTANIYCHTHFNDLHASQLLCYLSNSRPFCHENHIYPPKKQDICQFLLRAKDQCSADMARSLCQVPLHSNQLKEHNSHWHNRLAEMKTSENYVPLHQAKLDNVQGSVNNKISKGSSSHNSKGTVPNRKEYDPRKHSSTSCISHTRIMSQRPDVINSELQHVKLCGDELPSLEQGSDSASTQIDHDLIGFYKKKKKKKKKDSENQITQRISVEKLGRLSSIEARLKFLESCTIHGSNTLDALDDESICSTQNVIDEVEHCTENDISKSLLDQLQKGITEKVVQAMENSKKVLCNNKHISSASQTSCEVIDLQENAQKVSVYTQTDNFGRSNTGTTCIQVKPSDGYCAKLEERNNNCIDLRIDEDPGSQKETRVKMLMEEQQRILQLEKEMKEKDAEILKYKEGVMKMEEMMKVNGNLDSSLHHERLFEAIATAKAEILSLKETLDAMKHAKEVAESSLRDVTSDRNQLRQSLSKLTKSSCLKIQCLNAELETCRGRELSSKEEIKTLSSLLNLERMNFQKQLHETKLFSLSRPSQVFLLGFNSQEGNLISENTRIKEEARAIGSGEDTWANLEDRSQHLSILQTKEIAELKRELEKMRVQNMKSEQLEKEIELLRKRLEEAKNTAENMQETIDSLRYENDQLVEKNKILLLSSSEKDKILEENKSLSSMLSENLQKVVASEDALRVKNKMLDSQNESIRDLKSEITALKTSVAEKAAAMETMERNMRRKIEEEKDKVHELQKELAEEEMIFSRIEEELKQEKKANAEAETVKSSLLKKLGEKDAMLRYVESKIEQANELYESREKSMILDRDKALEKLELAIREKAEVQSQCEGLIAEKKVLEERERTLMEALEQQSKESLELTEKLLSTTASLHAQTEAQAKMKDAYSYKVNQLSKVLEELQDVSIS